MHRDRRREVATGFVQTSPDIGLGFAPNKSASVISSSSITIGRIRRWVDHNQVIFRFPDEGSVRCVFTGQPISEDDALLFIRCRKGCAKSARVVMCLASCELDKARYEVMLIQKGGFATFKIAVGNMFNSAIPIDRSLYY